MKLPGNKPRSAGTVDVDATDVLPVVGRDRPQGTQLVTLRVELEYVDLAMSLDDRPEDIVDMHDSTVNRLGRTQVQGRVDAGLLQAKLGRTVEIADRLPASFESVRKL